MLLITQHYPPVIDGVGDHSFHLKKQFESLGEKVFVLTTTPGIGEGVTSLPESQWQRGSILGNTILEIAAKEGMQKIWWQYVPYAFSKRGLPWQLIPLMQRLNTTGLEQQIFFHEVAVRTRGYGFKQLLLGKGQLAIARRIQGLAANTFTSLPLYAGYFHTPPGVVPIPPNILPTGESVLRQRNAVFCFTNRLTPVLLEALKDLDIRLEVAGKSTPERVKELAGHIARTGMTEKICLHGVLHADALSRIMSSCSIMVQPEPVRGSGEGGISLKNGTLSAALAHGLVVISECGDMTDTGILRNGENIVFVNRPTADGWRECVANLLANPERVAAMGKSAIATYQQTLDWAVTVGQIQQSLLVAQTQNIQ